MHEFIAIKIVSYFPSFEANLCLRKNQDGYRSKRVTAMGDLIIWKLSLIYSLSRVVHRVVQRKQFTFVFRVQNLCENAVSWQIKTKCRIGRWISFAMLKKKLQWIAFNPPEHILIF